MKNEEVHFPVKDKLHTDVMEEKYGPIHAVVLRHDSSFREALLVDKKEILRTYALTFFGFDRTNSDVLSIDLEIQNGGLIGKTFRKYGYEIKKNVIDVFLMDLPGWMKEKFKTDSVKAKARITEFYAKKGPEVPVMYGTVLEVYSPDFRNPDKGLNEIDLAQINPLIENLIHSGISEAEIWRRLDLASETNEWDDLLDKFLLAKELSSHNLKEFHTNIKDYIENKGF